ncbi:hypothetical protein CRENBAI_013459 [Crenichthys baileyi]|uniref:Uncharacterized protein n=1 Tax=Crenichthys baileyi TaxID=28760 RepID=A0AAV9SKB4_9TELE
MGKRCSNGRLSRKSNLRLASLRTETSEHGSVLHPCATAAPERTAERSTSCSLETTKKQDEAMEVIKVYLLISALGAVVFLSEAISNDDYSGDFEDYNGDLFEFSGDSETQITPITPVNNFRSLPSSAVKHSPQRGAVAKNYSLCLVPAILTLCMKA